MNTLNLIIARTNLSITIEKMKNSVDEIRKNHPSRTDLIASMDKSISDLTFSYVFFCELEAEYRTARQRNGDLEFAKLQNVEFSVLQNELKKAKESMKKLKEDNDQLLSMI